jgi:hypothetical protein
MRLTLVARSAVFGSLLLAVPLCALAQGTDTQSSPQCSAARLVGTWQRVSLLRNALSVQPPDAPLFVKFGPDGYWSMMEMPDDRPPLNRPPDQVTAKELFAQFDRVEGGQGTWTVKADGSVVTRRHLVNIAPGGENSAQDRLCWFEGDILALVGTGANRSPQARFKRLPTQPLTSKTLVGTWERTGHAVSGKPSPQPAPLIVILGEDGWYSQTQLPAGRKSPGKPMEQYTINDYLKSFTGVSAARGTYTVDGSTFARKYVANTDPNVVGRENVTQFTLTGDTMTLRGSSAEGATFESTFRRLKPLETTAK